MNRQMVQSSNVRSIGYDPQRQRLEVEFHNGSVYQYAGVQEGTWRQFQTAPSKGRFVWNHLRRRGVPYFRIS